MASAAKTLLRRGAVVMIWEGGRASCGAAALVREAAPVGAVVVDGADGGEWRMVVLISPDQIADLEGEGEEEGG